MTMIYRPRQYIRGEKVGEVDLAKLFGPLEVPVEPARWFMLRTHPGREFKVMKTFQQRNISAWLPLINAVQEFTRYRRGYEIADKRMVSSPLVSGVILIPDFEIEAKRWQEVDGTAGLLRFGDWIPHLTPKLLNDLRNIEAIGNTPRSKRERKFAIGELVRVANGPFKSFAARVERFDSKGRLNIGVEIFGRITPIDIDESDIEKV
jgi:transcriptional antiterminator NusG